MNLIFLGPPGAGKGTQSAAIVAALSIPQISTGDIIRAAIRSGSALGEEVRRFAESGQLVPDGLVNRLVEERLGQPDCDAGFLLDGYPRTVAQAETLNGILRGLARRLDHVLLLDVPDDVLLGRVTGRRSDPETGHVYHVEFAPPPPGVAARLIQRKDDTEAVFARRLDEYRSKTLPLVPFYERAGLLRRIDGVGAKDEIQQRIFRALGRAPRVSREHDAG